MEDSNRRFSKSDINVLKWIAGVCKRQIPTIIFMILLNTVYGSTSVVLAKFSKRVIDAATVSKNMELIVKYAVALLGIVLLQMLFSITLNCVYERCKGRIEILMRRHILDVIMTKDYASVTAYHTGELNNRLFNDITVVSDGITRIAPNTVFFITRLLSALIYLISIDKIFALVFAVGGLIIFAVTQVFRKKLKYLHREVQETEGKTRSFVQEIVSNLLAVKAFSAEDKMQSHTDVLQEDNFKARIRKRNFGILSSAGLNTVFSIGSVFAISFGAWRILNGVMTYGTVMAMIQLVNQVQSPFASLSGVIPQYFSMIASAQRLMEIDRLPDENEVNTDDVDRDKLYSGLKSLNFDNISFKYDRDAILENTSYKINKGDFVAIMGLSGIGKSTLLKLLLGVFTVSSGSITVETENGSLPVDKHTRRLFSYVPQGNMLISGTIRENITFVNDNATEEEINWAVEVSCAKQFIDELPLGINTVIGEKGLGLSEGQVQRLAIARSLLSKAPVLLLDEATSALDEETEKQFLTNLREMNNVTCIIVSHKKAALEICNKHIQIIDGKIVEG